MHYAMIGSIEGNAAALRACLDDIRQRNIERVVCLGDIVGRGPDPAECVDLVRERCFITIRGDHEEALVSGTEGFIPKTAEILEWSKAQLESDPSRLAFLQETLPSFSSAGITFVHGSPRSCHEYLFPSDVEKDPRKLRAAFAATEKVTFFTHTHVPGVITQNPLQWHDIQDIENYYHYKKGDKALVSVGSVGQPRDGDPRACYLEIKKNEMFWRRVEYDLESVVGKIRALGDVFAETHAIRLTKGR